MKKLFAMFFCLMIATFTLWANEEKSGSSNSPPAQPVFAAVNISPEVMALPSSTVALPQRAKEVKNVTVVTPKNGNQVSPETIINSMILRTINYRPLVASNNFYPLDAELAVVTYMEDGSGCHILKHPSTFALNANKNIIRSNERNDRGHVLKHPLFAFANNSTA